MYRQFAALITINAYALHTYTLTSHIGNQLQGCQPHFERVTGWQTDQFESM